MPDKEIANGKSKELAKYEKNEIKKNSFINFYCNIK